MSEYISPSLQKKGQLLAFVYLLVIALIFVRTPKQNFKKELLELDAKTINCVITRKGFDRENHNHRTIWYNPINPLEKDKPYLYEMTFSTYDILYSVIEVGDTIFKPKGCIDFVVKNRNKNKKISLDREWN